MRNSEDIPDEEYMARFKKQNSLLQHPYTKACRAIQNEIFRNPDYNEWKNNGKTSFYTLKDEYKKKHDDINNDIVRFRMAKFPELLFDIENDEKLQEIEKLKHDATYDQLIKGITYYTDEIHENDNSVSEINAIVTQIINYINANYPDLFSE
ncbi:MAG: hypothetical protein E6Q89_00410 [Bacteroidia bacterium]|nr:MAG: hypothetical protein E6Q89_00410 [Bacteroidia bacterium]